MEENKNRYVKRVGGHVQITKAGKSYLKKVVTDPEADTYSFTDKFSPVTIAAAMARLSRRGDDMRITLLDEFTQTEGKDEDLLQRIITAYGDDSVQQLLGTHVVVENASNLLTKKLEWGRLAAYLEQSTRYIYFDQKDSNGRYKYYFPKYLEPKVAKAYVTKMDAIFDLYSQMVNELTEYIRKNSSVPETERDAAWRSATKAQACDAVRHVLPVATKATVGIYGSGQAIESLIIHLLSDELPECYGVGSKMLKEARKNISSFLQRADIAERGVAMQGYRAFTYQAVKELATKYLKGTTKSLQPVQLLDCWPKDELDLLPDMVYEHSSLSLKEIQKQVKSWSRSKKLDVFNAYLGERLNRRHRPGRALEKAHYSWDLVCDYGIFRDLQRHRMVDDLEWQPLTPYHGYDIPELIKKAGFTDLYNKCFEISSNLYEILKDTDYHLEAQYAVLLGHKMRWKVTYNAREAFHLHELRTSPQGHPGYRKLVLEMHEKLSKVHPLLGKAMIFVNRDEDPELTRLAAERYSQFKLQQLDKKRKSSV